MLKSTDYLKVVAILLAFVLAWALSFVLSLVGLRYVPPTTLVFMRFAIASLFMLAIFGRRPFLSVKGATPLDIIFFFLASLSGVTLSYLLPVIKRLGLAPGGSDTVFLMNLAPVFLVLLLFAFRGEKVSLGKVAGTAAAVLGMIAIVANWERPSSFSLFSRFAFEESLILLSAIAFAIFAFAGKKLIEKYTPSTSAALTVWLGTILLFPLALRIDGPAALARIPSQAWIIILILGTVSSALAILLFYDALARVEASKAASFLFLTPIFITLMIKLESTFGLLLPSPLFVDQIIVGSILVIVGVIAIWTG
ncbi:MAG: DMT family transporter [Actinomycetota bacterium]